MQQQTQPTEKQILAKLRRKGGKTAAELGTNRRRMRGLERRGLVKETGRRPGGRGLPAVEFSLAPERKPRKR